RAGWAKGNGGPFDVTDIDRSAAAGVAVNGKSWGRPDDTVGLAGVVNGISGVHQQFLNAGGLGILVGDGMLPHPGLEQIVEAYYQLPVSYFKLTLDYQYIVNPAYNADRGPVSVGAARLHAQFCPRSFCALSGVQAIVLIDIGVAECKLNAPASGDGGAGVGTAMRGLFVAGMALAALGPGAFAADAS